MSTISALLCLWVRSGFSKGSVAGALAFFPPDPPYYKFKRIGANGESLPDEPDDADQVGEADDATPGETDDEGSDDSRVNESVPTLEEWNRNKKGKKAACRRKHFRKTASDLTERANAIRRRSKRRQALDVKDAATGITYAFVPDPRAPPSLPPTGSVEAIKIGPQKRTQTYIAALIYRVRSDRRTANTKTILYSHGNATDLGAMNAMQSILCNALEVNVVMYDYSGYGESGGIPMESNTYRDIQLVYAHTVKHVADENEGNVVVYGQSVGSGPSCYICSKRRHVGGLVLHSPFTSGMRVITRSRALAWLDIFPNIDRIKHVQCPVMVIHGEVDTVVDIAHGVSLHNAVRHDLRRDPWWVPNRGHNDITQGPRNMSEYIRRLYLFLYSLD